MPGLAHHQSSNSSALTPQHGAGRRVGTRGQGLHVEHHQGDWSWWRGGCRTLASGEEVTQDRVAGLGVTGQAPTMGTRGIGGVRQPFSPLPLVHPARIGQDGHSQVGRSRQGRRLQNKAAGQRQGRGPISHHSHDPPGGKINRDGYRVEQASLRQHLVDLRWELPAGGRESRLPGKRADTTVQLQESSCCGRRSHNRVLGAAAQRSSSAGCGRVRRRRSVPACTRSSRAARNVFSSAANCRLPVPVARRFRCRDSSQVPIAITGLNRANSA